MKRFIAFGACALFTSISISTLAQGGPPGGGKVDWTKAIVVTDGGSVYSEPDFDAKVAEYLSVKTPIWASRTAVAGKGGLGLFHRIHYGSKTGYMADVDIRMTELPDPAMDSRPAPATRKASKRIKSKALQAPTVDEDDPSVKKPDSYYFTRHIGGAVGRTKFSEKFENHTMRSMMTMYGLRMTGPGVIFDGPPLDFNILFSVQKPDYYSAFTRSVSGFMVFGDLDLMLPVVERDDWDVTVAVGPMYVYTNYKVIISASRFDSQEFRLGLNLGLGGGFRFGPKKMYAFRADVKGYQEKTTYYGHFLSFQTEF